MNTSVFMVKGVEGRKGEVGSFGLWCWVEGGDERDKRDEAVNRGPIVFVVRWC